MNDLAAGLGLILPSMRSSNSFISAEVTSSLCSNSSRQFASFDRMGVFFSLQPVRVVMIKPNDEVLTLLVRIPTWMFISKAGGPKSDSSAPGRSIDLLTYLHRYIRL